VRARFEAAIAVLAAMGLETREIRVPFERASFDVRGIERDRAAINASLFADVEALVLPSLTAPAPTIDEARARGELAVAPDNTFFCNYFGLPAVSVLAGMSADGLPFGVQLVCPQQGDRQVLALAQAYQRTLGWQYTPPPTSGA
jgi:aspartyl-tRNA(Asn)/glutamyl-tRNA(Gln) amidotransferase subunit A